MAPILGAVMAVNEGLAVINAVMPMIKQYMETGKEPTAEEVRAALAGMGPALKRLDDEIDRQGG